MNKEELAPIVLFTYNRIEHTKQTIEALKKNNLAKQSILYIFSDATKNEKDRKKVEDVRNYIKTITGFKVVNIIEREFNYGVADNLIDAITEVINKHKKVIMIEDDDLTSKYFLEYMNDALNLYKDDERVFEISPYLYPTKEKLPETFFLPLINSWGFGTWKRAWNYFEKDGTKLLSEIKRRGLGKKFDINGTYPYLKMLRYQVQGKNDSWAIRMYASFFLKEGLVLYPKESLVRNIGFDDTGTHGNKTEMFNTSLSDSKIKVEKISVEINNEAYQALQNYFKSIFFKRFFNKLRRILKLK